MAEVTLERVAMMAKAARIPLPEGSPARIAKAVDAGGRAHVARRYRDRVRDRTCDIYDDRASRRQRHGEAMSDPALLSLADTAEAIRTRKLSSVEATQALLTRIEQWQPHLNAFVRINTNEAMQAAKAADAAACGVRSERAAARRAAGAQGYVLHRGPTGWLRLEDPRGLDRAERPRLRSRGWRTPARSVIGALHMAEFAYGPTGHNAYLGPARNPWDPLHITGGSSSGSGAAVAARLTYAALGSDTGGSIRMPAHFCGVTGLKTTTGRVSRANAMPLSFTLDTVGSAGAQRRGLRADRARLIAGPDPLDPVTRWLAALGQGRRATRCQRSHHRRAGAFLCRRS